MHLHSTLCPEERSDIASMAESARVKDTMTMVGKRREGSTIIMARSLSTITRESITMLRSSAKRSSPMSLPSSTPRVSLVYLPRLISSYLSHADVIVISSFPAINAVFSLLAQGDVGKDPQQQILWVYQASVGLPSREYYSEPSVRSFYTHTVASLLAEIVSPANSRSDSLWPAFPPISRPHQDIPPLPNSGSHLEKERLHAIAPLASRIVSLESDLAHAGAQPEALFDPSKAYNPTAFDELDRRMPVNLTAYVSSFVGRTSEA
jgi:hypothetical protein